jgi:hypothetical protein
MASEENVSSGGSQVCQMSVRREQVKDSEFITEICNVEVNVTPTGKNSSGKAVAIKWVYEKVGREKL